MGVKVDAFDLCGDFFGTEDLLSQVEEDRVYAMVCPSYNAVITEVVKNDN